VSRLPLLLRRAKLILQTEGFLPLAKRGFPFVARHFFRYGTYDLYEIAIEDWLKHWNEADFLPTVEDFTLRIITTNQEADELEAEGLEFRSHVINARERLDKGAIAFCIFVGQELASIGWAATTEEARATLGERPIKVNFANNEYVAAGWWTNPKFRGKGLGSHVGFKRSQFLGERGMVVQRAVIAKGNIVALRAFAKRAPKMYAEARYLKILWWKFWKEKPLT